MKPKGLSLFNKDLHTQIAEFYYKHKSGCTRNCETVADCNLTCR